MEQYPKINTLYKRDGNNKIIIGDFSEPEFEYLKDLKFEATEKIDGTNISIVWNGKDIEWHGRTERAEIPIHLLNKLKELFTVEQMNDIFGDKEVILFGEGYGTKIQNGGNYIKNDVNFILFDVKIDKWWLNTSDMHSVSYRLGINHVPFIGYFTISEAEEMVKNGFKSTISENKDYNAEGLVLKTPCGLLKRNGDRIITKIKTRDYIGL